MKREVFSILFALVLVCSFSLIPAMPAMAATINVPGDYATIQAAIDAASSGDTINVAAGTYTEDLAIDSKNLTLVGAGSGADPASNAILRKIGPYASNLEVENATSLTVSGFRFIGGMWGIYAYDKLITVNIHDNVFVFHNQSGVRVGNGQSGSLAQNNEFIGCGGVEFWQSTGGTISGNSASGDGVGIFMFNCDGTTVSGNEVTVFGRGLRINSPAGISGDYPAGYALFGPLSWTDVTGDVVYAEPALADVPLTNPEAINGNIALIDRGTCTFAVKVKNAQDAGAIGVIIANTADELVYMAGDDASITIPAISVKQSDGNAIKAELATGVNATLSSTPYGAVIADEGIHIQSCNNITVIGNTVSKFTHGEVIGYNHGKKGAGIWISGGCDALTIENNNLTDNSVAVYIGATFASSSPTNVKINDNNIEGNAHYGVLNIKYPESNPWNEWDYHLFGAADATVDAEYNWWNHESGPTHAGNPGGSGDAVSDNVDYEPWLGAGVEEAVSEDVSGTGGTIPADESPTGGDVTVEGTGIPAGTTVTTAKYEDNPGGTPTFEATGDYYDVHLSDDTGVGSLIVEFCPADEDTVIYYWDGANWRPCDIQQPSDGCIMVTITDETAPSLSDLTGTPFASGTPYPIPPAPTPTPSGGPVGGEVYTINKASVLAPWLSLALIIVIGGSILVIRRRTSRQE